IRAAATGVPIYASSIATYFATRAGPAIGMSGAIVAMIRGVTGKRARLVGKPSRAALRAAAERLRVPASAIAVVGDDLALEIAMARAGGAAAVAVRTGLADAAAIGRLPESAAPHLVLQSVQDLLPLLDELIGSDHS
ncbi:MAG: HAD hydrolase-like protein, partial [Xanthobacteraceae bacterium]